MQGLSRCTCCPACAASKLFPFRYRDRLTVEWVKARYIAKQNATPGADSCDGSFFSRYTNYRSRRSRELIGLLRRHRALLAILFSLLFICTQQEAARHALTHFKSGATHQQLSSQQLDSSCIECELLAGSSAALTSTFSAPAAVFSTYLAVTLQTTAPAIPRRSFYRSRAPPALS
jgi:hypothetical protein